MAASRSVAAWKSIAPDALALMAFSSAVTCALGPAIAIGRSLGEAVATGHRKASTTRPTMSEPTTPKRIENPHLVCSRAEDVGCSTGVGVDDMACLLKRNDCSL